MPHHALDLLGVHAGFDEHRGRRMAEAVKVVAALRGHDRISLIVVCLDVLDHPRRDLRRLPAARAIMAGWSSILPAPFGNTRSRSPIGQASFHSLRALTTTGANGTSRSPAALFGAPIAFQASARCVTVMMRFRSTSDQRSPRSSEGLEAGEQGSDDQRPPSTLRGRQVARNSTLVGMTGLVFLRLEARTFTSATEFDPTRPRPFAT